MAREAFVTSAAVTRFRQADEGVGSFSWLSIWRGLGRLQSAYFVAFGPFSARFWPCFCLFPFITYAAV
jgi:hypothetical protein